MTNVLNLDDNQEENSKPKEGEAPSIEDQVKNYLQELVGDGKKFKDTEALAKGKVESDAFIEHLKEESSGKSQTIKELEDELRRLRTEKELDGLKSSAAQRKQEQEPKEDTPSPSVTPDDLESLIEKHLTRRESEQSAKANVDQTNAAIVKAFGDPDKAKAAVQDRATKLGMSTKDLTALAAKSPSAALALLGVNQSAPTGKQDLTKSSTVSSGTDLGGGNDEMADLEQLRRTNWNKYWSPAIQNRIFALKKEQMQKEGRI